MLSWKEKMENAVENPQAKKKEEERIFNFTY